MIDEGLVAMIMTDDDCIASRPSGSAHLKHQPAIIEARDEKIRKKAGGRRFDARGSVLYMRYLGGNAITLLSNSDIISSSISSRTLASISSIIMAKLSKKIKPNLIRCR